MLDCGLPLRPARQLAERAGANLAALDAVLLTHHHADHCLHAVAAAGRGGCPLYAHPDSLLRNPALSASERRRRGVAARPFAAGTWFEIGPLRCLPVRLPHDAEPTHGFLFEADGERAGFFTDLGVPDPLTASLLEDLDLLVLEFNHDSEMLRNGPYPPHIQARVAGDRGHLSNAQAAEILAERAPRSLRRLVLAHLSQRNNTPRLALEAARAALRRRGLADVAVGAAPPRGALRAAAAR